MADKIDVAEFRRVIEEANRQAKLQSEYAGNLGSVIKQFADNSGIDRRAITFVRGLSNKDPAKRDSLIIDILWSIHAMGYFTSESLIEAGSVRNNLLAIADEVSGSEPEQSHDAAQAAEDLNVVFQ